MPPLAQPTGIAHINELTTHCGSQSLTRPIFLLLVLATIVWSAKHCLSSRKKTMSQSLASVGEKSPTPDSPAMETDVKLKRTQSPSGKWGKRTPISPRLAGRRTPARLARAHISVDGASPGSPRALRPTLLSTANADNPTAFDRCRECTT
jgi:hypothetical protein